MNFKLSELEEIFDKIKTIIKRYEISKYAYNRNKLYLANGDELYYSVPENTIAHLLGIDTNYLMSTRLFKSKSSFSLLKELCNNAYRINTLKNDGIIAYNKLFSQFILEKISNFDRNIKINLSETELICKYNPEISYFSEENSEKYDYIIIKKFKDNKIGLLGIVKFGYNSYVPMSNQIYDNIDSLKEKLNKLIRNQAITSISGLKIKNEAKLFEKSVNLSIEEKIKKIRRLTYYKNNFNSIIDVSSDFEYSINKIMAQKSTRYINYEIANEIVSSIETGKLINLEDVSDNNLARIIKTFNDFLCSDNTNSDPSRSYSNLKEELKLLKEKILEINKLNAQLKQENTELKNQNEGLIEENSELKTTQEKIYKILKPRF